MRIRKLLALVAVVAAAPLLTAAAAPGEKTSADGISSIGPARWDIKAGRDGELTGNFSGALTLGTDTVFFAPEGSPTCLTVEGNKVAFIYRVEEQPEPQAIYVTAEEGKDGAPHHIGFAGPGPIADFPACPIGPAPLEFTGDLDITDKP